MYYSTIELRRLISKTATLRERFSGKVIPLSQPQGDKEKEIIERRINNWCEAVGASGNEDIFNYRLALDGVDKNSCGQFLGNVIIPEEQPLPGWAITLNEILKTCSGWEKECVSFAGRPGTRTEKPLPFEHILFPFVNYAWGKVTELAGKSLLILSQKAKNKLQRQLLYSLCSNSALAFNIKFQIFVGMRDPLVILDELYEKSTKYSNIYYSSFVRQMLKGGLKEFFNEYPVLAKLTCIITENWLRNTVQFLENLHADLPVIEKYYNENLPLGQIAMIMPGLSDSHNGGKTVISLQFQSGLKLVYKPKDLGTDEAWYNLLGWLNRKFLPGSFKIIKVLNRSTHG